MEVSVSNIDIDGRKAKELSASTCYSNNVDFSWTTNDTRLLTLVILIPEEVGHVIAAT